MYRVFVESALFTSLVGKYLSDDEYSALQRHLLDHPSAGVLIRDSGGVRKLRWRSRLTGKRGGVRVIYYIHDEASFWMLTIYRKGEVDSIPGRVLRQIKEVMKRG